MTFSLGSRVRPRNGGAVEAMLEGTLSGGIVDAVEVDAKGTAIRLVIRLDRGGTLNTTSVDEWDAIDE